MPDTPTPPPIPITPPPAPPHRDQPTQRTNFSLWRFSFGLLIILFGLSLLAQQFGWTWFLPEDVWKLWPIFIILAGLSLLTRDSVLSTVIAVILGLAIVAGSISLTAIGTFDRSTTTEPITIAAEPTAAAADIRLNMGAAKITVGGGATHLVDGTFTSSLTDLDTRSTLSGTTQMVDLTMDRSQSWWWGGVKNALDLDLTKDLPLTLDVNTGATDLNLDLTDVQATDVNIDSGASSIKLTLGDRLDSSRAAINAGASSITMAIPKTVGVTLSLDAAVSRKTLPDFVKQGDSRYVSTNFAASAKKLDLRITAGASSITVDWQ